MLIIRNTDSISIRYQLDIWISFVFNIYFFSFYTTEMEPYLLLFKIYWTLIYFSDSYSLYKKWSYQWKLSVGSCNEFNAATTLNAFKLPGALMAKLNIHEGITTLNDYAFTHILCLTTNCLYRFWHTQTQIKTTVVRLCLYIYLRVYFINTYLFFIFTFKKGIYILLLVSYIICILPYIHLLFL